MVDADDLIRVLAEPRRRRVVAALILGATTVVDLAAATGLSLREVVDALDRLESRGLATEGDGHWYLLEEAFTRVARQRAEASAAAAPADDLDASVPADHAKVLRAFVRDGRLVQIPVARSKRLVILDRLAQEFEPGRRYSEAAVNLILGRWHADTAALRRYLVDERFLDRAAGQYWRAGGTYEV